MSHSMDLEDADDHLRSLIRDSMAEQATVSFTEQGAPLATVVAAARLDAMQRTLDLLNDAEQIDEMIVGLSAPKKPGAQLLMEILRRKGITKDIEIPPVPTTHADRERDLDRADQLRRAADLLRRLEDAAERDRIRGASGLSGRTSYRYPSPAEPSYQSLRSTWFTPGTPWRTDPATASSTPEPTVRRDPEQVRGLLSAYYRGVQARRRPDTGDDTTPVEPAASPAAPPPGAPPSARPEPSAESSRPMPAAGADQPARNDLVERVLSGLRRLDTPPTGDERDRPETPGAATQEPPEQGAAPRFTRRPSAAPEPEPEPPYGRSGYFLNTALYGELAGALRSAEHLPTTRETIVLRARIRETMRAAEKVHEAGDLDVRLTGPRWWHRLWPWNVLRRRALRAATEAAIARAGATGKPNRWFPPTPPPHEDAEDIVRRTNEAGLLHPSQRSAMPAPERRKAVERGTPVAGSGWMYGLPDQDTARTTAELRGREQLVAPPWATPVEGGEQFPRRSADIADDTAEATGSDRSDSTGS
jgi:hypothetical protein